MSSGNEDKQKPPDKGDAHAEPDHKSEPRIRPRDNIDRSSISVVRRPRSA